MGATRASAAADICIGAYFPGHFKFFWGANPRSLDSAYLIYGTLSAGDFSVPVYNLLVMLAAIAIAAGLGLFLQRTNYGRLLRATAAGSVPHHRVV